MTEKRTFLTYKILTQALTRDDIKKPGGTAKILLDCFLTLGGELKASLVENRELCKPGTFKPWRDDLIAKGWLNYTFGNYSRHEPGPKLVKYINKEKMARFELATVKDIQFVEAGLTTKFETANAKIDSVDERQSELEKAFKAMDSSISIIVNMIDPPTSPGKVEKFKAGGYEQMLREKLKSGVKLKSGKMLDEIPFN